MKTFLRATGSRTALVMLALVLVTPALASAQSTLDVSEAQAFLGSWALAMESPQGNFVMDLEIVDSSGKIAVSLGSDMMGGMQEVTDVSRAGENLVLRYEFDAQGQIVPVAVTLVPAGAELDATMDFADGMFTMYGRATK